jgi:hypothetical protein
MLRAILPGSLAAGLILTAVPAFAQNAGAAKGGAKAKACSDEAHATLRRASGRNGGSNADAARAQWKTYFDSCMAR